MYPHDNHYPQIPRASTNARAEKYLLDGTVLSVLDHIRVIVNPVPQHSITAILPALSMPEVIPDQFPRQVTHPVHRTSTSDTTLTSQRS